MKLTNTFTVAFGAPFSMATPLGIQREAHIYCTADIEKIESRHSSSHFCFDFIIFCIDALGFARVGKPKIFHPPDLRKNLQPLRLTERKWPNAGLAMTK